MMDDMTALIQPMIPALRRYARALLRDRAEADDLAQDCLERAVRNWRQRRQDGDARAWVFAILHNLAMSRLRASARRPATAAIEDVSEGDLASPAAQEDGLRYRAVLTALNQLPEDQRAVLLLVGVEDLTYAEAARVLDVPIGTVMSRLSRARERLSGILSGEPKAESPRPYLRRVK